MFKKIILAVGITTMLAAGAAGNGLLFFGGVITTLVGGAGFVDWHNIDINVL